MAPRLLVKTTRIGSRAVKKGNNVNRDTGIPFLCRQYSLKTTLHQNFYLSDRIHVHRFFSSDSENGNHDTTADDLPSILARELAEEERLESNVMPEDLANLLSNHIEPTWRLVDTPSHAVVRLHRRETVSGSKVVVRFHCQDTLPPDLDLLQQGIDAITPENESDEDEDPDPVRFDVIVTRAGKSLVFRCISDNAAAVVEGTVVRNEDDQETTKVDPNNSDLYEGPDFTDLPEDMQSALTDFVQTTCGVDENLAAFVSMYADYKEQVEYLRWMEGVSSLVD